MPDTPTLVMPSDLSLSLSVQHTNKTTKLGDGYEQYAIIGTVPEVSTYTFTTPALSTTKYNTIRSQLEPFASTQSLFSWSPDNGVNIPFGNYYINTWTVTRLGPDSWTIAGSLKLDPDSACTSFSNYLRFDLIPTYLTSIINFLKTYTRDTLPLVANAQGVTANSFHTLNERNKYIPNSGGSSETQTLLLRGLLSVVKYGTLYTDISQTTKNDALTLSNLYSNALLTYFYNASIPTVSTSQIWLPHWLVNAKSSIISKGSVATKSINNGFFDVSVSFINGVGYLPTDTPNFGEKLSNVYKVYSVGSTLLWKNVYTSLVMGAEFPVNYWVQNLNLAGINYKTYPDSKSHGGTRIVSTSETAGKIVLTQSFTGTFNVCYTAYVGPTINKNSRFGLYPDWRTLDLGELNSNFKASSYLSDVFKLLKDVTGNTQWDRAYDSNKYSIIQAASVSNPVYIFKADNTQTEPFQLPGTRLVITNNNSTSTLSRLSNGWTNASIGSDSQYVPRAEFQNISVALQIQTDTTLDVNVQSNVTTCLEVYVSLSKTLSDTTQQYTYYLPVVSNTSTFVSIKPDEFIQFTTNTLWHLAALNPNTATYGNSISSYSSSGGLSTNQSQISVINGFNRYTTKITFDKGLGNAGVSFNYSNAGNKVPGIYYKKTGLGTVDYKIKDSSGNVYLWDLPDTVGLWSYFKPDWTTAYNSPSSYSDGYITGIDLVASNGASVIEVWYIGDGPVTLPYPSTAYKTAIVSRVNTAHNFSVGNVLANNSPSSTLFKSPGVVPFTVKTINGVIDSWTGSPLVGYQSPYNWYKYGEYDKVKQVLDFIDQSQTAYSSQKSDGLEGNFSPYYKWGKWDQGNLGTDINTYAFTGSIDPNYDSGLYQNRAIEDVARYWMEVPKDTTAKSIVTRYLREIDRSYKARNSGVPYTNYPPVTYPFTYYYDPSSAALLLRAALYANIAGGNPAITFRVMRKSMEFLISEYISTGNMAGTFTKTQKSFTSGGQTYSEFYGYDLGEVLFTLTEMVRLKSQINYPSCSTSIT